MRHTTAQATLLSNGTITLQGAKIHGDMVAADGGKVVLQANSLVTGDIDYGTTISLAGSAVVQGTTTHQSDHAVCRANTSCLRKLYPGADSTEPVDHRRLHL